ncbi:esterase [Polaromonas sp. UC242_47]|uniref:esterase n=1 Tax=Polaromonas sp. UC242_47 TaxID=3374626 RepID=UPI0037B22CFB
MTHNIASIDLLPVGTPRQLFVLLHGGGGAAVDMLDLASVLGEAFAEAAIVIPEGFESIHLGKTERQWFPVLGLNDENRPQHVAAAVPALAAFIREQQERFGILQSDTALAGFAEGATLALALSNLHDGLVGRVLAFCGRFAALPDKVPTLTTLHLLHGRTDAVVPVQEVQQDYAHLMALKADATCDIASSIGHELHPALMDQAVKRLQTCVPLRFWRAL